MADKKPRKGLGRGLSALLNDASSVVPEQSEAHTSNASDVKIVPIESVSPSPDQPRKKFPPGDMQDLANSISEKGVLQPLLVRPDSKVPSGYSIVAGERRWRAAQMAKLHEIPVIIRALSDDETLEIAIVENVQRADLDPIEEAQGYQQLIERFGHSQSALSKVIGKSRPYIANALRLLSLPDYVKDQLTAGRISSGHARALVTTPEPSVLARKIVEQGLSVRQTEDLARQITPSKPRAPKSAAPTKDADTRVLEADLSAALNLKVAIRDRKSVV